jgi:hypothetical protein
LEVEPTEVTPSAVTLRSAYMPISGATMQSRTTTSGSSPGRVGIEALAY